MYPGTSKVLAIMPNAYKKGDVPASTWQRAMRCSRTISNELLGFFGMIS
jgi:hypothetical protein